MPNDLRLPRAARLTGLRAFDRVFASRSARSGRHFRIHYTVTEAGVATPRLGMTVSKRVARRAVERNRVRRQIRESFRLHRPELARLDFVVRALPSAAGADNPELRRSLNELWSHFRP
ncbi:ribonuclease P protein component [Wenzhouxiangella sp. XN79A]|uniref:ribonuclease P protein component n=1 Tax=Wenzhouxiangella sp. XN79A TaxID=2724193 RepID=UPI00144AED45|nr:ribonuclease P protein component [Wenzhouxiangella sp. XN79A]NKI35709.1 ribonuclease P protein component [Wenzhouxiangella sp. XN79A]